VRLKGSLESQREVSVSLSRAWLVPAAETEDAVLDEWAELHHAVLGYPPNCGDRRTS
jgi:hypothetical protein